MNINEIIDLERGPRSALIEWLQRRYLLADPLQCARCNQAMELTERNDNHVDGFLWYVAYLQALQDRKLKPFRVRYLEAGCFPVFLNTATAALTFSNRKTLSCFRRLHAVVQRSSKKYRNLTWSLKCLFKSQLCLIHSSIF